MPHLATAGRAVGGQLGLGLFEVALSVPARETKCNPVAEGLAPLLAEPVRGLAHTPTVLERLQFDPAWPLPGKQSPSAL